MKKRNRIKLIALVEPYGSGKYLEDLKKKAVFYAIWRDNTVQVKMVYDHQKDPIQFDEVDSSTFLEEYRILETVVKGY